MIENLLAPLGWQEKTSGIALTAGFLPALGARLADKQ